MRTNSLSFRLVAGAAVSVAVAVIVAAVLLDALFHDYVEQNFRDRLIVQLDSLIAASDVDEAGRPVLRRELGEPRFAQPLSGWYWQIVPADGGPGLRSRSLWDSVLPVPEPVPAVSDTIHELAGPGDERLRAASRRITLPDAAGPFIFTVAGDTAEIGAETRPFTLTLVLSLGILGIVLVAAVFVQVRFGLMPLRRIPRALAAIRSGHAERLSGDFPAEVEPLAVEINALIDHSRDVVERSRRHVGNLAHALKTPLTVLGNEASRREGALAETVARQTAIMTRHVNHYLARARTAARARALGARTEVHPVLEDLRRTLVHIHRDRAVAIAIEGPPLVFRGEREDLEEMVGNLMENACKWADGEVRVVVATDGDRLRIAVEDDGPGLPAAQREAVVARGHRLDESKPGSGLGLAIVADVAELYGGVLRLDDSPLGGLAAVLELPAAG